MFVHAQLHSAQYVACKQSREINFVQLVNIIGSDSQTADFIRFFLCTSILIYFAANCFRSEANTAVLNLLWLIRGMPRLLRAGIIGPAIARVGLNLSSHSCQSVVG